MRTDCTKLPTNKKRYPLCRFKDLHLAAISDIAWSPCGRLLAICSQDGYITFVRFDENEVCLSGYYYYYYYYYLALGGRAPQLPTHAAPLTSPFVS